ncbi:MAG: cysteine desulfurase [bacterium]|nr:cysteine desulfurase [bacterium]
MNRIYLDHAATTPLHSSVIEAINRSIREAWGNPSSLHFEGRTARKYREQAREQVAALLQCSPEEIYFTSSGSESDQWAIQGTISIVQKEKKQPRIIVGEIEHSAVRNICKKFQSWGFDVQWLKPDKWGRYQVDGLAQLLNSDTILVSLMYCNNEIGTIQEIEKLCELSHRVGALFHTDAVQALGKLPSPILYKPDLVSISAHKINGPKGVGALYIRSGIKFSPWIAEASQEKGMHAGTEAMPAIVGFGAACELWNTHQNEFQNHLRNIKSVFLKELQKNCEDYEIISPNENCSDTIVNIRFPELEAEALLLGFDLAGVAASAGSACASGALKPSPVLLSIGLSEKEANECIRFSFGPFLTEEEIIQAVQRITQIVNKQRKIQKGIG